MDQPGDRQSPQNIGNGNHGNDPTKTGLNSSHRKAVEDVAFLNNGNNNTSGSNASAKCNLMPVKVLPTDEDKAVNSDSSVEVQSSKSDNESDKYFGARSETGIESEEPSSPSGQDKYEGSFDMADTGIKRRITQLWPETLKWRIKEESPNYKRIKYYIVEKNDLPAFQFLVLQGTWLKKSMKKSVDKSFKVEINEKKCKVTFKLTLMKEEKMIEKVFSDSTELMKSLSVLEVNPNNFPNSEELIAVLEKEYTSDLEKCLQVYETSSKTIVIVGFKKEVADLYSRVCQPCQRPSPSVKDEFIEEDENFGLENTFLFEKLNGYGLISKKYPEIKIELMVDKVKISGQRQNESLRSCIDEIRSWPNRVKYIERGYDKFKLKFLELKEVKKYFEECSLNNGIHCTYTLGAEKATIKMYGLSEQVIKMGFDMLNKCVVEEKYELENIIFSSQAYIDFIKRHSPDSGHRLLEHTDEQLKCILIVATDDVMLELKKLVHSITKDAVESKKSIASEKVSWPMENQSHARTEKCFVLKPDINFLLQNDKCIKDEFTNNFPQVKIDLENEEGKPFLRLSGTEEEIEAQSEGIKSYFDSLGTCYRKIPIEKYTLIDKNPVLCNYMTNQLLGKDLMCYWRIEAHQNNFFISTRGKNLDIAKMAATVLENSLKMESVCAVERMMPPKIQQINDIIAKYVSRAFVIGLEEGTEDYTIVATDDIFSDCIREVKIAAHIQSNLLADDIQSNIGQSFFVRLEKHKYMQQHMMPEILDLGRNFHVTILLKNQADIHVKSNNSNSNNEELCISEIKKICSQKVGVEYIFVPNSRLVEKVKSEEVLKVLSNLETTYQCVISHSTAQPEQICSYSWLDCDYHVVVVCGRTSSLEVDAVVLPVNECLFPIGYSDELLKGITEPATKNMKVSYTTPKKYGIGDIVEHHDVWDFPFQLALLTVMTTQNQGVNKGDIKKAMKNVFKHCETKRIKSLAIPVQISEFTPVSEQAEEIIEELQIYYLNEKNTALQEVYICVLDENGTGDVVNTINTKSTLPEQHTFDWRPLIMNPAVTDGVIIDVEVVVGSLVNQNVDLLVNTVGIDLKLNNGIVSNSVLKKAGTEIQTYCDIHHPKGILYGQVVETPVGKMINCKSLCHGALTHWYHRANISLQVLRLVIWQCLIVANNHQYKTVAFPAFGTGKLNYPARQVAETMLDTVKRFGEQFPDTTLQKVKVVVYKDKDNTKEDHVVKTFQSVLRRSKSADTGNTPIYSNILECIVPAHYGNVCLQVLPMILEPVHGDFIVTIDKSCKDENKLFMQNDGALAATFSTFVEASKRVLQVVKEWRLTDVCIIVKINMTGDLEKGINTVQEYIFNDSVENGCLQSVKVYVEAMNDFNQALAKLPNMDKSISARWFGRKISTGPEKVKLSWRKSIDERLKVDYVISFAGNKEQAHRAKNEFSKCIQSLEDRLTRESLKKGPLVFRWAVQKIVGTDTEFKPLSDGACKAIAFAIEKGELKAMYKENGIDWIYKFTEGICYMRDNPDERFQIKKQNSIIQQEETEGSSVDHETQPQSFEEDIFSWTSAEIDCSTLSFDTTHQIDHILSRYGIQITSRTNQRICLKCSNFDQLCSLNDELKSRTGIELMQIASPKDKALLKMVNQKSMEETYEKIVSLKITETEYKLLKHFMSKSRALTGKPIFKDDSLIITLQKSENEDEVKKQCQTDIEQVRSLNNSEILYPDGITENQVRDMKDSSPGNVFYDLSNDKKMLILFAENYSLLGEAKHKAEIILGLKQASRGRRGRVFVTEPDFTSSRRDPKPPPEGDTLRRSDRLSKTVSSSTGPLMQMTLRTTEGLIVKVYNGNILSLNVDCIVNAANENLQHGGGVACVISSAAGYDFERESDDYIRQNGPIPVGECCTTSAGRLQYKHVIHTVGPKWYEYPDKKKCAEMLKKAVESCFFEAEVLGMKSIAIPSISAGIFGVPKEVCCTEYANAVEDFSRKNGNKTCLKEIHFIDKDMGLITYIQSKFGQKFNLSMPSSLPSMSAPSIKSSLSNSGGFSNSRFGRSNSVPEDSAISTNSQDKNLTSSMIPGSPEAYKKLFMVTKDLKVIVVKEDIITMKVSTVVCPQDNKCSNKGAIARAIEKVCDETYRKSLTIFSKGDIRKVKASPKSGSLPFQYVLHVIPPRYDKYADTNPRSFELDLEITMRNILQHCSDKADVTSFAMPVLGIGKDEFQTPVSTFAKLFIKVLQKRVNESSKFRVNEIYVVTNEVSVAMIIADEFEKSFKVATSFQRSRSKHDFNKQSSSELPMVPGKTFKGKIEEGENCIICMETFKKPRKLTCGHVFCGQCIDKCFKVKPVCPTCGAIQGVITGDQPAGEMKTRVSRYSLPGFSCWTISIDYEIFQGYQGKEHPNPGKYFKGISRRAYLPNNEKGKVVAELLKIAFQRKLVFTIGHSRTTGEEGVVTWNDIHHKTSTQKNHQFGYPDDGYLDRVMDELKIKGVTEADIK